MPTAAVTSIPKGQPSASLVPARWSRPALSIPICAVAVQHAGAQAFNIDFGIANPFPGNAYGAAAGSGGAGFWNAYPGGSIPLLTTAAIFTGVTINGGATGFLGNANDPATLGDDDALLDDYIGIPYIDSWTVTGLAAGPYDVYGYTWTFTALPSGFNVNGAGVQTVGGAWPGSYQPGLYSHHTVTIAPSQPMVVTLYSINGAIGVIRGLQIVPVPAPGGAAALVVCGATVARRRRR